MKHKTHIPLSEIDNIVNKFIVGKMTAKEELALK